MKKLNQSKKLSIYILIFVTLISIIIIYNIITYFFGQKGYENKFIKTNFNLLYEQNSSVNFIVHNKNIFFANKNGIKYINENGKSIWENTYSLNQPIIISEGDYVLIMEKKGYNIYVYNSNGMVYSIDLEYPVISASLNKNGYSTVILQESEESYQIICYTNAGIDCTTDYWKEDNVFPLSCDISNDNRILVISALDISGIEPVSRLMFWFLNEAESSEKTNLQLVSGTNEENRIISMVKFMDNNTLITVSDKEIVGRKEDKSTVDVNFKTDFRIPLTNKINKIIFDNSTFTYSLGENILNEESEDVGTIKKVTSTGKIIADFKSEMDITYIESNYNSIIIGDHMKFNAFKLNGELLWEYNSVVSTSQLLFYKNNKTILEYNATESNILKLKRVKINNTTEE